MKLPGPDHPIAIACSGKRVRISFAGKIIADTTRALTLQEAPAIRRCIIFRADTDMCLLKPTRHPTHCPYKGDASYFTIEANDRNADNAAWSCQQPYPAVKEIKDHLAFYPNRVDGIEEVPTQARRGRRNGLAITFCKNDPQRALRRDEACAWPAPMLLRDPATGPCC